MFCTKCGAQVKDGAMFCPQCGNKIINKAATAQSVQQEVTQQPAQLSQQAAYQQPVQAAQQTAYQQPVQAAQQTAYQQPVQAAQQAAYQQPVQAAQQTAYQQPVQAAQQTAYQQPVQAAQQTAYQQPVQATQQTAYQQPVQATQQTTYQQLVQATQQTAYQQPVQPAQQMYYSPAQNSQQVQQTQGTQPKKKKSKLGLILGLSLGIPALLLVAVAVLVINLTKNTVNKIKDDIEVTEDDSDDKDSDDKDSDDDSTSGKDDDSKPDNTTAVAEADIAKRTVMVYMVGSNLECPEEDGITGGAASADLYEMLDADIPEDANVVLECGGAYEWEHPSVPDGEVSRLTIENNELVLLEELGVTTMTQTGDLADFITYASTNYPAENYVLILWDHGGSIPISFGMDQLGDEYDLMTDAELRDELQTAGVHFESVIFDACNMCTLEIGLALKDYSDYMVGAESYVNGVGIYYTNWLELLDGDTSPYCEQIAEDYMDSLDAYDLVGSMSVIRLDRIDEVYEAYVDYIASLDYELTYNYAYTDYYKARSGCGAYEGTDSVDLITLANKYVTDQSTALINCVENAVVYTESDIAYGHGLTAYSPSSDYCYLYNDGRTSLVSLGYDEGILDFYDKFVSEMLANMGYDYVAYYGGDWYIDDYDVADAGASDEPGYLEVEELDYYYGCMLTDDSWEIIDSIEEYVIIESDDVYLFLGSDYQCQIDSNGYIALVDPEYWIFINDNVATYYGIDYYEDTETGEWAQTGIIPVTVNGNEAYLYIYFDEDNATGSIQGYYLADFETGDVDETTYMIEADDVIDLVYVGLDYDGNELYENNNQPVYGSELEIGLYDIYDALSGYSTLGYVEITDVYGNTYDTDMVYLGAYDSVQ